MRFPVLVLVALSTTLMASAEVRKIAATLAEDGDFDAPEALQELQEGVVWLDLTMEPSLAPSIERGDATFESLEACDPGPVAATTVSIRTGSNHLLLDVHPGSPDQHAANLLSCNYAPQFGTESSFGTTTRLTGCYFANSISIPTAVQWILNPLPADACHYGN